VKHLQSIVHRTLATPDDFPFIISIPPTQVLMIGLL